MKEQNSTELNILYLEDNRVDIELVRATFDDEKLDYKLKTASSRDEFTAALEKNDFDIILADFSLPSFDGLSALELARKKCPDKPFIIVSGTIGEETAIDTIKNGATDYVLKQRLERLVPAIKRAMDEAAEIVKRKEAELKLQDSYDKLHKALVQTVNALSLAVETRDPYVAGHQIRVAKLAKTIGEELGLKPEKIEGINLAASLHDIGKINIPAGILSKPGKLNELEIALLKNHSKVGYDILKGIEFPWPLADIVYQHHEKIDGTGYPRGLIGDQILLEARILCVADVVEAMSSHRPYRPARGEEAAMEEIAARAGKEYDPDVVDACYRLFKEKNFTFPAFEEDDLLLYS